MSAISAQRFSTYLDRTGTTTRGLQLYAWNTAAAASMYGPLQTIEVALRNAVNDAKPWTGHLGSVRSPGLADEEVDGQGCREGEGWAMWR